MCIHYSAQFKKWHNLYLWNLSVHLPASFPVFSPLRGESCHFLPYHSFACLHSFTKYVSICKQHFVQIYVYFMYIYYIYLSLMACRGPRSRMPMAFCNNMNKKVKVLVAQTCLTLFYPLDHSLPGSSVHGILQARILEWVAISFSRGSSWPRDQTWVPCKPSMISIYNIYT